MRLQAPSIGFVLLFLVVVIGCLQLLQLSLLSQLEDKKALLRDDRSSQTSEILALRSTASELLAASHVIDKSGDYSIIYDVFNERSRFSDSQEEAVTLISQCSIHLLHQLPSLLTAWSGPVSIAIFTVHSQVPELVNSLLSILHCSQRHQVSFHFVLPLSHQPIPALTEWMPINCDLITESKSYTASHMQNYALGNTPYPSNLLRNTASYNIHTDYHLVIDIDMVPSQNLSTSISTWFHLQPPSNLTAYVIPAFEIEDNAVMPKDKTALLELLDQGDVRPFYFDLCWKCQKYTDYEKWRSLAPSDSLHAAYEIEWKDPWEPFFVAPITSPVYDERFKQYGFNRISQVCEMHISGMQFSVINSAFLLHKGFKTREGFHLTKNTEQEANRVLFRQFKQELKTKYPQSERKCY